MVLAGCHCEAMRRRKQLTANRAAWQWLGMTTGAGIKLDGGKPRLDLLPVGPLVEVAAVFGFGADKYAVDGWRTVQDAKRRYYAAALRHLTAWWGGEATDAESGYHHLAHAGCCVLILLWHERNAQ